MPLARPVDAAFVERQREEIELVAAVIRERHAQEWALESAVAEPDDRLPYALAGLEAAIRRGWAQVPQPTTGS